MPKLKLGFLIVLILGPFILVMTFLETREKEQIAREGNRF